MNRRFNMRFYFVIFFIFLAVVGVGFVVLTDSKGNAEDIEFYYAELKDKVINKGDIKPKYIYIMKVLYKDNASDVPMEHSLFEVRVKEEIYEKYGVKSVLKGYFDAGGRFHLAGLSEDEPYEGLQPH